MNILIWVLVVLALAAAIGSSVVCVHVFRQIDRLEKKLDGKANKRRSGKRPGAMRCPCGSDVPHLGHTVKQCANPRSTDDPPQLEK